MLPGIAPPKAGLLLPSKSFIATAYNDISLSSYNFTVDTGAATERSVVCEVLGSGNSGSITSISGTIAGVAFSILVDTIVASTYAAIVAAKLPSSIAAGNQTVSIVCGASWGAQMMSIASYRCLNLRSLVPTATLVSSANPGTGTINVDDHGLLFACARCGNSAPTYTWAGITEEYDFTVGTSGRSASGGSYQANAAEVGRMVTATRSVTGINYGLVAAVLR
ncbi:hypothetical protein A9K71_25975 [Mesorhizobium sp. WSM3873]|nr:hypothetical protein A9K71_25975 [Mesorhizobium sp. WSM3873]